MYEPQSTMEHIVTKMLVLQDPGSIPNGRFDQTGICESLSKLNTQELEKATSRPVANIN